MRRCSMCQSRIALGDECIRRGPRDLLCLVCSLGAEFGDLPVMAAIAQFVEELTR
jgi:hypothetical protein